jgi:exodeoxyribonuclease V gamma subunit
MVPMRLLPFRAICVLGMNDGDYPRRDPGAGLNQLTAELGTRRRRAGDRSLRDDDRFLFLQLFAAAADVFYLSYLGADPRDGSTREPSVLVSELLAATAAYHAIPGEVVQDLVLRHPLQPFSPTAFGSDDTRHYSYREHWHPAAGRLLGARTTLAPWMDAAAALAPPVEVETELSLDALRRFLMAPAEQFLRQRLGLRLAELDAVGEDVEPLQAPGRGLERSQLQRAVFNALLAGGDADAMHPALRARGLLPTGPLGRRALAEVLAEVRPYAQRFVQWRGEAQSQALPLEVEIDGVRLHGNLADAWPQGIARLRFGERNGPSIIRNGLDWLLASAAGNTLPLVEFHEDKEQGVGPHHRPLLDPTQARDALRVLLGLRSDGLRRPLPFAPRSGWKFYSANTFDGGVKEASKQWHGGDRQWAEGGAPAYEVALRARDPFANRDALREFVVVTTAVFAAVASGISIPRVLDEAAIARVSLVEDDDE